MPQTNTVRLVSCVILVHGGVEMNIQRVIVTGSSGLVGSAVVAELFRGELSRESEVLGLNHRDCDLRVLDKTVQLFNDFKPDLVIHCAARVYGLGGNLKHSSEVFLDNLLIDASVVEASRRTKVKKFVAMGSAAIYGDLVDLPMNESQIWLGPPHDSERAYAQAKRAMLAHLEALQEAGDLDYAYAIATNLYGPNDRFSEETGHVVPSLVARLDRAIDNRSDLEVWGTGIATRDLLFSTDLARALLLLASDGSGPVNLASGVSHSIREIVETLVDQTTFAGDLIWNSDKPEGQLSRRYDTSKIRSLGFEPEVPLDIGLKMTFDWYRNNRESCRR